MHEPWRELPWSVPFWIVYLLVFSLEVRWLVRGRGDRRAEVRDRGTSFALLAIMFVAVAFAFWFAVDEPGLFFTWRPRLWFSLGLALMLAGAVLRQYAISVLGRHFTGMVTIQAGHELVERGLYRYVRHPSYTGAFVLFVGLGLALDNGASLAALALAAALAYGLRVRAEEAALAEAFGDHYREYCRRTKRFVPGLF